jgi:hypothetical protein
MWREVGGSVREFDFATKLLVAQAAQENRPTLARENASGFFEEAGCLCRSRKTVDGPITIRLNNFVARIVAETIRDDGAERRIYYGIEGKLSDEFSTGRTLPRVEISADEYEELKWVGSLWGSDAIINTNESRNVVNAIKELSLDSSQPNVKPKIRREVYGHTGWRFVDSKWRYLHAAGAIPALAGGEACVELPTSLAGYRLPSPPTGEELIAAIRKSLSILTVVPRRIGFPLLATTFRAASGPCDFALSIVGRSGLGKTELAGLAQQHYGAGLDARHLPSSWSSTANFTEYAAFITKDGLLVIDDFAPAGNASDIQRYRMTAERIFRATGNSAGRNRMNANGTLRPATPPRTTIISTGEDVAGGHSARARQLVIEIGQGDLSLPDLTPHQLNANAGIFAQTTSGFVAWMAPQYEEVQKKKKELADELRHRATVEGQHARTPGIVAELAAGFSIFLDFAFQSKAITADEQLRLHEECWCGLMAAAENQIMHQAASDPVQQFLRLLNSGLVTGRFHIASADRIGYPPDDERAATWGWRKESFRGVMEWRSQGPLIGWLVGEHLLLDPKAVFAEIQRYATAQNTPLAISDRTLWKMLKDRGTLLASESRRSPHLVRHMIHGQRLAVLQFLADSILEEVDVPSGEQKHSAVERNNGEGIDANERSAFPNLPSVATAANSCQRSETPAGQVGGQVAGRLSGPDLPTIDAEKAEEKCEMGGLGRSNSTREAPKEFEEYFFTNKAAG